MKRKSRKINPGLSRVAKICLGLPEAMMETHVDYAVFRVRKKVFAYYLNDHDGDGIVSVCVKSERGENVDRADSRPDLYYLPRYIGPRGWFGMRLDRGRTDWNEVRNIVEMSYRIAAPKTLSGKIESGP